MNNSWNEEQILLNFQIYSADPFQSFPYFLFMVNANKKLDNEFTRKKTTLYVWFPFEAIHADADAFHQFYSTPFQTKC